MTAWYACAGVALVVAVCRVAGMTSPAFQAAAHLYVGGLVGVWLAGRALQRPERWAYLTLAGVLSAVETWAFLARR